jgi:flagellar biosynthesis/type III secretory pathway protein FliH
VALFPGRRLLERFRPAAPPGSVPPVAVPSEAAEDAELLAVLAALRPAQRAAEQIREQARASARATERAARERVAQIGARAQLDAATARAEAAVRVRAVGEQQGALLIAEARRRAEELHAAGEQRIPAVVQRVIGVLRAEIFGPPPTPGRWQERQDPGTGERIP